MSSNYDLAARHLVHLLQRLAAERPDDRAYSFWSGDAEERLSYRSLDERARGVAARLQARLRPGDRALLLHPPGLDYLAAFFGCLYSGVIAVPSYPPRFRRPESLRRLAGIVADAGPAAVLTTGAFAGRLERWLRSVGTQRSPEVMVAEGDADPAVAAAWEPFEPDTGTVAFLQFTSGSTGDPRGVVLTHGNLLHNQSMIDAGFGLGERSEVVSWLPVYHDMGLIGMVLHPLYKGIPCTLMSPAAFLQQPFRWLELLSTRRADTSGAPDFAYDLCVRKVSEEQRRTLDLSCWKVAFSGAEPVRAETLERFRKAFEPCGFSPAAFYPCYGLAEASLIVTGSRRDEPPVVAAFDADELGQDRAVPLVPEETGAAPARPLVGCGRTLCDEVLVVADPVTGREVEEGRVGEIRVASPSVAAGYWGRPRATAEVFGALASDRPGRRLLRTGDLGFLLRGELYVTGRLKDLIIIRGRNLYPQDLEVTAAASHPSLRPAGAAAFSIEAGGEERLVVVQEVEARERVDPEDACTAIRRSVAEEHGVEVYGVVLLRAGALPRTSSGKVRRRASRREYLAGELESLVVDVLEPAEREEAPRDELTPESLRSLPAADRPAALEASLIHAAAAVLRQPASRIDPELPLDSLGLDSLLTVELRNRIEETSGRSLPLGRMLRLGSLREIALCLAESSAGGSEAEDLPPGLPDAPSLGEESLLLLHDLAPARTDYHLVRALVVEGELDAGRFDQALRRLLERHPALRTGYERAGGGFRRRVDDAGAVASPLRVVDDAEGDEGRFQERLEREAWRPFELAAPPLARFVLYRRSTAPDVLLVVVHHLIADLWSLSVLVDELSLLYARSPAPGDDAGRVLPPLPARYEEYVAWQRRLLNTPRGDRARAYWRRRLDGVAGSDLPSDRSRAGEPRGRSRPHTLRLGSEPTRRLGDLARRTQATPFIILLAAFQVLLARLSGSQDVVVGAPAAGRGRDELAPLVGYFVQMVPLRARLGAGRAFTGFLEQVRRETLEDLDHQDLPLPAILETLEAAGCEAPRPLFRAVLVLQRSHLLHQEGFSSLALGDPAASVALGDVTLRVRPMPEEPLPFDLSLRAVEHDGGIDLSLLAEPAIWDDTTAKRWLRHLETLLAAVAETPDRPVAELPLLTRSERHQAVREWGVAPEVAPAPEWRIGVAVERRVRAVVERSPQRPAVVEEARTLSFAEIGAGARRVTRRLRSLGLGPGDLVAVLLERSAAFVEAVLGVLESGAAYLPVDPELPRERIRFLLGDSGARALVTDPRGSEAGAEAGLPVVLSSPGGKPFGEVAAAPDAGERAPAYVVYTSGSTGRPKGTAADRAGLANLVDAYTELQDLRPADRVAFVSGLGFDAHVLEVWPTLAAGATLVIPPAEVRTDPLRLADWLGRREVSVAFLATPLAEAVLDDGPRMPALRRLGTGGDRLRRRPAAKAGFDLINYYGPAEATVAALAGAVAPAGTEPGAPALGRPIAGTRVHLVDLGLRTVPPGAPGEIVIGGRGVGPGYLGGPRPTAERFAPDPWTELPGCRLYRTGDRGRQAPDGRFAYLGRADSQVQIRGVRVEPGEVESVLASHPGLSEAAVLAPVDAESRPSLVAWVVPAGPEASPSADALRAFLLERLPPAMVPARIGFLPRLPVNASGKIDRRALAALAPEETAASVRPRTPIEEALCAVWAEVLGRDVGATDDFFALGGHSLAAGRLVARINELFGTALTIADLFDTARVDRLAERVGDAARTGLGPIPIAERSGGVALTPGQERLWLTERREAAAPGVYNVPAALHLAGSLDPGALRRALARLVERHEILRARVRIAADGPRLRTEAAPRVPWTVADLSRAPERRRREAGERALRRAAALPFDLERQPPLRALVVRLDEREHLLLVSFDHLVTDGWSMRIFADELAELYRAAVGGEPPRLPDLPVQFADFAAWRRRSVEAGELEGHLAAWRGILEGGSLSIDLPTDRPRSAKPSPRVATREVRIPAARVSALAALCSRRRTTLFVGLESLFALLLGRLAGRAEVVVTSPVAGRLRTEVEPLIGFFVNLVPLRNELGGGQGFGGLLERVGRRTLEAYSHQEAPFERLVEELRRGSGDAGSSEGGPSAVFAWQGPAIEPRPLGPVVAERLDLPATAAKFDLTLALEQDDGGAVRGTLEFRTALWDRTTVSRWIGHLGSLLDAALAAPDRPVEHLAWLAIGQRHQLLVEADDTGTKLSGLPLHALVDARAAERPDAIAVVCGERQLSYGELVERSRGLAGRLRPLLAGTTPSSFVGVLLERSADLPVALLAILRSGAAYLPLAPGDPRARIELMLREVGARAVITEPALAQELSGLPVTAIEAEGSRAAPAGAAAPAVPLDAPAYVSYTSGSTGRPKGVMVPHRGVARLLEEQGYVELGSRSRVLHLAPLSFDASTFEIWGPLLHGGTCVVAPPGLPGTAELGRVLERHRVDTGWLTASLFNAVVDEDPRALEPLAALLIGGEALSVDHVRRALEALPALSLSNGYGPTESTTFTCVAAISRPLAPDRPSVPIGRPIANTRVRVLDRRLGPVPHGVPGQLHVGGAGLAVGYLGRPGTTAERFLPDPWSPGGRLYATGDLVRSLADGRLDFLGRLDRQVKLRGFRIEPAEIELALLAHPGVREAVVEVRRDGAGEGRLVAYLVPAAGALEPAELRHFLGERLAPFLVPAAFVPLDALPRTRTGKIDRAALPAPEAARTPGGRPLSGGRASGLESPWVEILRGHWSEVLGGVEVGPEDDLFALGGHSLVATRLVGRLRRDLEVDVPLEAVFEHPTPAGLAAFIGGAARPGGSAPPPVTPAPPERGTEPSFGQERLWFLDRLEPDSPFYNVAVALRLSGRLSGADAAALEGSWSRLVSRHDELRSRFIETEEGDPAVRVAPPAPVRLPRVDLTGLPRRLARVAARRAGELLARRPFDLERGPLFRISLLRVLGDETVLALVVHHVVADGWSMSVLLDELAVLFTAAREGDEPALPDLPVRYRDYAAWQRDWFASGALDGQLQSWRDALGGGTGVLELPADRPRSSRADGRGPRGALLDVHLPSTLREDLERLGRSRGCTLFMTLLAGFGALLHRLTGEPEPWVGTPVAGRVRPELEGLVGLFVNSLVLRLDVSGEPDFERLLARTRREALDAFARQDVPFGALVEELQPTRSLGHSPLFQVLFVVQTAEGAAPPFGPLEVVARRPIDTGTARLDLTVSLRETPEGIAGSLEYDRHLFDPATVERLWRSYRRLLAGAVADPAAPVGALALLEPAQRHQVTSEWQRPATPLPEEGLAARFERWSAERPGSPAVAGVDGTLTYGELERRANRWAHELRARGVRPGRLVGLFLEPCFDLFVALTAVLKAGGAYVPLDPTHPRDRIAHVLADTGLSVILTDRGHRPKLPETPGASVLVMEETDLGGRPESAPPPAAGPRDLVYVTYTSGSTGRPKGVEVEQRGVLRLLLGLDGVELSPRTVTLLVSPLVFDVSVFEIWGALLHGGCCAFLPSRVGSARQIGEAIRRHGVNTAWLTSSLFNAIVDEAPEELTGLERLLVGGEALSPRHVRAAQRALPGTTLFNGYGPTEATTFAATHRVARPMPEAAPSVPVGRPIGNTRLHVADPQLRPVPAGVVGELCIGGAGLARGYLGRRSLTAERFVPDPFGAGSATPGERLYRTGDRVRHLADGTVDFLGRFDHQVKVRGFRIELGEIETCLLVHPGIAEGVVRTVGPTEDLRIVAYLVPVDAPPPAEELTAFLRRTLPDYMVPSAFVNLESLPLKANGKVDDAALPAPGGAQPAAAADRTPPSGPLEAELLEIWREVLGPGVEGVHQDFFDLGGHSLKAIQLVARVRRRCAVDVELRDVFRSPTVADLARTLSGRSPAPEERPIERVPDAEDYETSAGQRRLWVLHQMAPTSVAYHMTGVYRLEGHLDTDAFGRAFAALGRRHEALRTTFRAYGGEVRQTVGSELQARLAVFDLAATGGDPAVAERRAWEWIERTADLPFDLERGPLLRSALLRIGHERHLWFVSMHHAISDGWSVQVLLAEMAALYNGSRRGDRAEEVLPPPPLQFRDYAAWHNRFLGSEEAEAQVAFWLERLQGELPRLDFPYDHPRPETPRFAGATHFFRVPPETARSLHSLARDLRLTTHGVLLALYGHLLALWAGRDEVVVGSLASGRTRRELEPVMGTFANFLPQRVRRAGGAAGRGESWEDWLRHVGPDLLAAYDHAEVPFDLLIDRLGVRRDPARNPLFDTMLVFHGQADAAAAGTGGESARFDDLDLRFEPYVGRGAALDFKLDLANAADGGMAGRIEYRDDLLDTSTVDLLAERFLRLLAHVGERPTAVPAGFSLQGDRGTAPPPRERPQGREPAPGVPVEVVITATFTAEPLTESLRAWCRRFGLEPRIELAPYDQVFQEILDPGSLTASAAGAVAFLIRFEDWIRDPRADEREVTRSLESDFGRLVEGWEGLPPRGPRFLVLPPVREEVLSPGLRTYLATLYDRLAAELGRRGAEVVDLRGAAADWRIDEPFDPERDRIGHVPFSDPFFAALGTELARRLVAWKRRPFKVIAVDCDNTLWSGVCGEDGPAGLEIDAGHRHLQSFLVERQRQGMLLALCSKNNPDDVWRVFAERPDMVLRREHLVAHRLNWEPKSENLRSLSADLDLGLDSFVFLDDSAVECLEVTRALPQVLSLPLPPDPSELPAFLDRVWAFDVFRVTDDDRRRTALYRAERERSEAREASSGLESFLAELQLEVRIAPASPARAVRVAQLTQRTNQFNTTLRRRTEDQVRSLLETPGWRVWTVEVEDRFGAYGVGGAVIGHEQGESLLLDSFLLSCRVLGRGVEAAVLAALRDHARSRGLRRLHVPLVVGERNQPARQMVEARGWRCLGERDGTAGSAAGGRVFEVAVAEIPDPPQYTRWSLAAAPRGDEEERPHEERPISPATAPAAGEARGWVPPAELVDEQLHRAYFLPLEHVTGRQVLELIRRPAAAAGGGRPPATPLERQVARIWSEALGVGAVDLDDDFFALGGNSLLATSVLAHLRRELGSSLELTDLFRLTTVEALAAALAAEGGGAAADPIPRIADAAHYPTSSAQRRMYVLHQIDPGGTSYNNFGAYRLRGRLDRELLASSFRRLVRRHEALRTRFDFIDGRPVQVVEEDATAIEWLSAGPDPERVARDFVRPFDLERGPLARLGVVSLGPEETLLLLDIHHIVSDGYSLGLVSEELLALYAGRSLPEPMLRYRDYAAWESGPEARQRTARAQAYWLDLFTGEVPVLDLPTDLRRPAVLAGRGDSLTIELEEDLTDALRSLGQRRRATLFMTLLAAWAALLHRYSGQSEVVVGTPAAGRTHRDLQRVVGMFVNTLALRLPVDGARSFEWLLEEVRDRTLASLEHQDFPFERLVECLSLERDTSRNPLFDVMVSLQRFERRREPEGAAGGALGIEELPLPSDTSKLDLSLDVLEMPERLLLRFEYSTELFTRATVERMAGCYRQLLEAAAGAPERRVAELPLLGPVQRLEVVDAGRGRRLELPLDTPLPVAFEAFAARQQGAPAVTCGDETLTYAELDRWTNAVARELADLGVGPERVVGVMIPRSTALVAAILGVLKAGGAYLPIDPTYPGDRIDALLEASGVDLLLVAPGGPAPRPGFAGRAVPVTRPDAAPEAGPPPVHRDPRQLAYLIFTSGTTGRPKGVMVEHRHLLSTGHAWREEYRLDHLPVRLLQLASASFDVFSGDLARAFLNGGHLVLATDEERLDLEAIARLIDHHRITLFEATPQLVVQLMRYAHRQGLSLDSLSLLIFGSDALKAEDYRKILERFGAGRRVVNSYGITETTIDSSFHESDLASVPETASGNVPIGPALPNVEYQVLDARGEPLPLGVPGELYVGGAAVSRGYHRRPALTAERFVPGASAVGGRLYRSGDRVRFLPGGDVELFGRSDRQVKIRGVRVEPGEIENLLLEHPAVREAVVTDVKEPGRPPWLAAWAVVEGDVATAELRTFLAGRLPEVMLPRQVTRVERIPVTPNGKVDLRALPRPEPEPAPAVSAEPTDELRRDLTALWKEVLGLERVASGTSFFELGGNSLLLLELFNRIQARIEPAVRVVDLFSFPSIDLLASHIESLRRPRPRPVAREVASILERLEEGSISLDEATDLFDLVEEA